MLQYCQFKLLSSDGESKVYITSGFRIPPNGKQINQHRIFSDLGFSSSYFSSHKMS